MPTIMDDNSIIMNTNNESMINNEPQKACRQVIAKWTTSIENLYFGTYFVFRIVLTFISLFFFYFFPISLYIYFLYLELQCPEPEPPSNGKIIIKSKSGGNQLSSSSSLFNQTTTTVYLVGDYIQFGCRKGYRMIGSDIITCLHTEQWSSLPPKCKLFFFRFQKMEFNSIQFNSTFFSICIFSFNLRSM